MNQKVTIGPFFTWKEAACYLGYHPDTLRRLLKEEGLIIPSCGPRENRYAKSVLDTFMASPETFNVSKARRSYQSKTIEIPK